MKIKLLAYLILATGIGATVYASYKTHENTLEKERLRFEIASKQITISVKDRIDLYSQILYAVKGLFDSSEYVDDKEWREFVKALMVKEDFPAICGVGFSKIIDSTVKSEVSGVYRSSIVYLEPQSAHHKEAIGYDMFSDNVAREAMYRAFLSKESAMSGKIKPFHTSKEVANAEFLMYAPVFKKHSENSSTKQSIGALDGFVFAAFHVKDLIGGILEAREDIDLEIYDGQQPSQSNLIFDFVSDHRLLDLKFSKMETINVGGRAWTLVMRPSHGFGDEVDLNKYLYVFAFGLAFSFAIFGAVATLVNLKERAQKLAEKMTEKLAVSEERLKYALEGAGDGLWDWNILDNTVFYSKKWKESLGHKENEIYTDLNEWKDRVHPDDLDRVYNDIHRHLDGITDAYTSEYRLKQKDGSYKWVFDRGVVAARDKNQKPLRIVGSYADITRRKIAEDKLQESKDRLQATMDGVDSIMYVSDMQTYEVIFINDYGKRVTGDIIGQKCYKAIQGLEAPCEFCTNDKLLDENGKAREPYIWEFQNTINHKWYRCCDSAITWSDGRIVRLEAATDITSQKEYEKKLEELVATETAKRVENQKLLIQQSKMATMGEMIAAIGHQWRQPLNALGIIVQDIAFEYESGELEPQYVAHFRESALEKIHMMSKTIDDFKNFFSPNKQKEEFYLHDSVYEILKILNSQLKMRGIEATIEKTEEVLISSYKNELKQVLLNVLANAKDALSEKKPKNPCIKISFCKSDNTASVFVEDNAGGIDETLLERIFEPYFTTKSSSNGTGIGLYMSRQIVEDSLKGRIYAKNAGSGAKFIIELPI